MRLFRTTSADSQVLELPQPDTLLQEVPDRHRCVEGSERSCSLELMEPFLFECFIFRLVLPKNPIFPSGKCCVCVLFGLYPPAKVSNLYFLIKPSTASITSARCLCLREASLCWHRSVGLRHHHSLW